MAKVVPKTEYKERESKEESVQKIILALQNWLHRDSACVVSKVPRSTFYERLKEDAIRTKVEDAEEYWMSVVEKKKQEKIEEGYRPAIEKELKSKRRSVYGDKLETSGTVIETTIDYSELKNKTPQELDEMRKKILGE